MHETKTDVRGPVGLPETEVDHALRGIDPLRHLPSELHEQALGFLEWLAAVDRAEPTRCPYCGSIKIGDRGPGKGIAQRITYRCWTCKQCFNRLTGTAFKGKRQCGIASALSEPRLIDLSTQQKKSMKNIISLTACALSITLLSACASAPDRDKETALNQQVGIEVTQTKQGVQVRLPDRVLFDFDKSALRADSGPALNRAVVLLKRSKKSVIVEGHTDNTGTHEYNQSLSEARAQTVASALEQRGIVDSRIATKGFAYDKPAASNDTPEGQAKNRRTEIVVIGESLDAIMGKPSKQ